MERPIVGVYARTDRRTRARRPARQLLLRRLLLIVIAPVAMLTGALAALEIAARTLPPPSLDRHQTLSDVVLDASGGIMRVYLAADDHWRLATTPQAAPPGFIELLLAYEDRRFRTHNGVDYLALARAAVQAIRYGRIVSGASTLTMQTARLLERHQQRGLAGKLRQMVHARQLERMLSKDQILALYLTLAPYGGNLAGLRAAALAYFRKEPARLTAGEMALLVAVPQAPEARRPDRHPKRALNARTRMLTRLRRAGLLHGGLARRIAESPSPAVRRAALMFMAPHLADQLRGGSSDRRHIVRSLIEPDIQAHTERVVEEGLGAFTSDVNIAAIVVRNADRAVVGYVGGARFGDVRRAGHMDLATAIRSPGSTLKPFIYALGFEHRLIHPQTIITDAPLGLGGYEPRNFSGSYVGDLTIRDALIQSVNTGAVAVLAKLGPRTFVERMAAAGIRLRIDQPDGSAGLAIGLGGAGVTLVELAGAYAALADGGVARPLRFEPSASLGIGHRLVAADAAWAVADILADMPPPKGFMTLAAGDGGRRLAYKTGTSYGYRDAWAIGFDAIHTIGVWVGRPDGASNLDAYGVTAAAPLLYRIAQGLERPAGDVAMQPPVEGVLDPRATVPQRLKRFETSVLQTERRMFRIVFPEAGSQLEAGGEGANGPTIPLVVQGGTAPFTWFVDGRQLLVSREEEVPGAWRPATAGAARLTVIDAAGRHAEVNVWIEPGAEAKTAGVSSAQSERRP